MSLVCHAVSEFDRSDEAQHPTCECEEWTFSWWRADGSIAGHASYRLVGRSNAWYCWGLWRRDEPLLHVTEFDIPRRSNPMIAKAEAMWAEFTCDAPFEQWTLGNETYAVELDDPAEALERAYGRAVPIASDLEWYATSGPVPLPDGYAQAGRLLGSVETVNGPLELDDLVAHRTHRWSRTGRLDEPTRHVTAHLGPRLPFRFPDGVVRDLYLTNEGLVGSDERAREHE